MAKDGERTMTKFEQVLRMEPSVDLVFKGPFTDVVTNNLTLTNLTDREVAFKVKTTAPKQYCVRPNSGRIAAHSTVTVAVMLQPFDYVSEDKLAHKHKFMVQAAFVPPEIVSLDEFWKTATSNQLMDSRLRVIFDMPEPVRSFLLLGIFRCLLVSDSVHSLNNGRDLWFKNYGLSIILAHCLPYFTQSLLQ
ncbi:unnamed protein product [Soboliphyme baturini]|uniref:Major sperm protein n=1 Tax=Soboliphyme baturini TaxID=241478 RepID=A0A183J8F3_9BILA|nr:unnamed protein product [Soboliphyme baturini]